MRPLSGSLAAATAWQLHSCAALNSAPLATQKCRWRRPSWQAGTAAAATASGTLICASYRQLLLMPCAIRKVKEGRENTYTMDQDEVEVFASLGERNKRKRGKAAMDG